MRLLVAYHRRWEFNRIMLMKRRYVALIMGRYMFHGLRQAEHEPNERYLHHPLTFMLKKGGKYATTTATVLQIDRIPTESTIRVYVHSCEVRANEFRHKGRKPRVAIPQECQLPRDLVLAQTGTVHYECVRVVVSKPTRFEERTRDGVRR